MKLHWILPVIVFALALTGCGVSLAGKDQDPAPQEPQQVSSQESPADLLEKPLPTPQNTSPNFSPVLMEKFVNLAKNDLAKTLVMDPEQISVLDSKEMTWPDVALGCPAPGIVYAQGPVSGYRIWLNAGGVEYDYHTDLTDQVILCSNPNPDNNITTNSTPGPDIGVPIK